MIELADDQQRVRPNALAQDHAALGVVQRGAHLREIAVADAEPFGRGAIHEDAAMTGDVVRHFLDELDADVAAPGVLHAARGDEPERIIGDAHGEMLGERVLPQRAEVAPMRERFVFRKLLIPPMDALLVQASLELLADAQEPLLVGLLEAQALLHELRIKIPHQS